MNKFFNKAIRKQTIFIIILTICAITIFYGYELKNARNQEVLQGEWEIVELAFDSAYREALDMNTSAIVRMEESISRFYFYDKDALEEDLKTIHEVNDLTNIFYETSIQGKYLLDIVNDNNDPFIMSREMIVLDASANCSANIGSSRSFDTEINQAGGDGHFNKVLAQKAIDDIVDGNKKFAIWNFLTVDETLPWYEEIRDLEYVDMTTLKELFFKYEGDPRILETFEVLVPSYIYRDEDLIGNKTVTINGFRNESYQLILVQGFNICDVLEKLNYAQLLDKNHTELNQFNSMINMGIVGLIGFIMITFAVVGEKSNKENGK